MKPLSKTKEGRRYRKAFERKAGTPAQRVLEDPSVPEERKTRVENPLAQNDPIALGREIDKAPKAMRKAISVPGSGARCNAAGLATSMQKETARLSATGIMTQPGFEERPFRQHCLLTQRASRFFGEASISCLTGGFFAISI